jgi:hypothetical protein
MEQATAFANPFDWDLSGFGALANDPEFAEALETELSEAVIEMRGKFVLPWWARLASKFFEMAHSYSANKKQSKMMAAASQASASAQTAALAAEARRSAEAARSRASKSDAKKQ